jgi:hypothetical protein
MKGKRPDAAKHPPPRGPQGDDHLRVGGRVHAVVRRRRRGGGYLERAPLPTRVMGKSRPPSSKGAAASGGVSVGATTPPPTPAASAQRAGSRPPATTRSGDSRDLPPLPSPPAAGAPTEVSTRPMKPSTLSRLNLFTSAASCGMGVARLSESSDLCEHDRGREYRSGERFKESDVRS